MISLLFSKLLPLFVYPVGLTILACMGALCLSYLGFVRASRIVLATGVALLWISSTPLFANWLYSQLEAEYPPVAIESLPQADAAILLGGAVNPSISPRLVSDANDAIDRVFHAARLFHAGKVEAILISGGNLPWRDEGRPEAMLIADLLVELGIPRPVIALETESRNTRENGVNSARIVVAKDWRSVLLVTSGSHMPRALAVFRHIGIEATPAAADIRVTIPLFKNVLDLIPSAESLARTTGALKEHLGLLAYRLRGWA